MKLNKLQIEMQNKLNEATDCGTLEDWFTVKKWEKDGAQKLYITSDLLNVYVNVNGAPILKSASPGYDGGLQYFTNSKIHSVVASVLNEKYNEKKAMECAYSSADLII